MLDHLINLIFYQTILVNNTQPCFLNYTSPNMFQNCGLNKDYIQASLVGWQYITGGNFSLVIAILLCIFTYIKYHKIIYPMLIGVFMLPISAFLFPASFFNYALFMLGLGIACLVWWIVISQSNE